MSRHRWSCLSNHGLVLLALSDDSELRLRDIAEQVGLTERAVQRIVTDLAKSGLVDRRREGRRNLYTLRRSERLRHPLESHRTVGDLLDTFGGLADQQDVA